MKAHTNPMAQYILVSISGRNSKFDTDRVFAEGSRVTQSGVPSVPHPTVVALTRTSAGTEDPLAHSGKSVTNNCNTANPAMYAFSSVSMITKGKDLGNLCVKHEAMSVDTRLRTHSYTFFCRGMNTKTAHSRE